MSPQGHQEHSEGMYFSNKESFFNSDVLAKKFWIAVALDKVSDL